MMNNTKQNKVHRPIKEIEEWWLDQLESISLEDDLNIKEVIPIGVLHLVKRILGLEDEKRDQIRKKLDYSEQILVVGEESVANTVESNADSDELKDISKVSSIKGINSKNIKAKAYIRFFQRPNYKASIWRETIYTKDQMTINQQSIALTESIANKFVEWVASIGGEEHSKVNKKSILKMFDISTTLEYETTCKVDPKEILTTINIEKYPTNLSLSKETKNILSPSSKMQPRGHKPSSYKLAKQKLETAEIFLKNITNLKSTRAFLQYLSDSNSVLKPPKYLNEL